MLCHDFGILKRERPTMTDIQSVFDLCPDIQEQIGKELAPLVKSKKLMQVSIKKSCKIYKRFQKKERFGVYRNLPNRDLHLNWYRNWPRHCMDCAPGTLWHWQIQPVQSLYIHGFPVLHVITKEHDYRITFREEDFNLVLVGSLDQKAKELGLEMPKSWKKKKKIHYLMKTEE